jgi:hypothetical protein
MVRQKKFVTWPNASPRYSRCPAVNLARPFPADAVLPQGYRNSCPRSRRRVLRRAKSGRTCAGQCGHAGKHILTGMSAPRSVLRGAGFVESETTTVQTVRICHQDWWSGFVLRAGRLERVKDWAHCTLGPPLEAEPSAGPDRNGEMPIIVTFIPICYDSANDLLMIG